MSVSKVVYEHDIPSELTINLDQTPLSYIPPGKYTFNIKGFKNVPVRGIDDKRQITTYLQCLQWEIFISCIQLIYTGNTKRCLFLHDFNVKFTKNHWYNMEKAI